MDVLVIYCMNRNRYIWRNDVFASCNSTAGKRNWRWYGDTTCEGEKRGEEKKKRPTSEKLCIIVCSMVCNFSISDDNGLAFKSRRKTMCSSQHKLSFRKFDFFLFGPLLHAIFLLFINSFYSVPLFVELVDLVKHSHVTQQEKLMYIFIQRLKVISLYFRLIRIE